MQKLSLQPSGEGREQRREQIQELKIFKQRSAGDPNPSSKEWQQSWAVGRPLPQMFSPAPYIKSLTLALCVVQNTMGSLPLNGNRCTLSVLVSSLELTLF